MTNSFNISWCSRGWSAGAAVVRVVAAPEVIWATFSAMMVRLRVLFTEGNFKALYWLDRVSRVVHHVNDCMGHTVNGKDVLDLFRARDDTRKI